MDEFAFDTSWEVDKAAEKLNSSLFGSQKKRKKSDGGTIFPHEQQAGLSQRDSDDELFTKKEKKKLKERNRKLKKKLAKEDQENDAHVVVHNVRTESPISSKKSLKKRKRDEDVDSLEVNNVKKKSKKSCEHELTDFNASTEKENPSKKRKNKQVQKEMNAVETDATISKKPKSPKKRKSDQNEHNGMKKKKAALNGILKDESNKKKKEKMMTDGKDKQTEKQEDEENKRKKRRNKKKKNNPNKNKYRHLALNRKSESEETPGETVSTENNNSAVQKRPKKKKNVPDTKSNKKEMDLKPSNLELDSSVNVEKSEKKLKKKKKDFISKEVSGPLFQNSEIEEENFHLKSQSEKKSKKKQKVEREGMKVKNLKKKENNNKELQLNQSKKNSNTETKYGKNIKDSPRKLDKNILKKILDESTVSKKNNKKKKVKDETPSKKKHKNEQHHSQADTDDDDVESETKRDPSPFSSIWGKAANLAEQAKETLNSARFRYINEQLYTCTGGEAMSLFKQDKEAFHVYHDGYRRQVARWEVNPLHVIIRQIKDKPASLIVADFGCGEAMLSQTIPQTVHSFDLVAANKHVIACDMSKVPLSSESVDIAVFCLSLMGTNLHDYVAEANRVLKTGGLLKVAEVVSRFKGVSSFVSAVCAHGFTLLNKRDLTPMFYLMDFKKTKQVKKSTVTASLTLKPCIYKRR